MSEVIKGFHFSYSNPITSVIQPPITGVRIPITEVMIPTSGVMGPDFITVFLGPHLLGLQMNDFCKWWFQQIPHPCVTLVL